MVKSSLLGKRWICAHIGAYAPISQSPDLVVRHYEEAKRYDLVVLAKLGYLAG
jgi:hypothetical protein